MSHKNRFVLFPVYLTYFLDNFGLAIIYPIFTPLLLMPSYGLVAQTSNYFQRLLLLGVMIGSFPFAQFFGAPLIGQFSDRFGRKKAFFISILGSAIGYSLTAVGFMMYSTSILLISRLLTGFFASNLTLCLAAIVDKSPDEHSRAKNFGQIAAIGGLSFILAIALGGILSDPTITRHFNPSLPFGLTALLTYLNLLLMMLLFHETHVTKASARFHPFKGLHNIRTALKSKELKTIYVGNFFFICAWVASMQFLPTFLLSHFVFSTSQITLALIAVGALWSLANLFLNRQLSKHFHPSNTLVLCLLLLSFLLFTTLFTHNSFAFFALFYPAVCCASLCWTNSLANVSLKAPSDIQGSILGVNQSMTALASMLAPPLGGIFASLGHHWIYIFASFSSCVACLILWRCNTWHRH